MYLPDKPQINPTLIIFSHLGTVETDKSNIDWPSTDEGYVAKILFKEGDNVKVGDPVIVLVDSPVFKI